MIVTPLLLVSCPTPNVTLTFTNLNCPEDDIKTTVTPIIIGSASPTRAKLRITICVYCLDKPVTGASVQGEVVKTEDFDPPDQVSGVITFNPTNAGGTGCTDRELSLSGLPALTPPSSLKGKDFKVTIKDTAGTVVETQTVKIQSSNPDD